MKEAEKAAAQEARAALVERLRHAKEINLHEVKRAKYFRLVAEVLADGENLSDALLAAGLAPLRRRDTGADVLCGDGGGVRGFYTWLDDRGLGSLRIETIFVSVNRAFS